MAKYTIELMTEDLTDEELGKVVEITKKTICTLIGFADKHNIDRDSFVKYFADVLSVMCKTGTFKRSDDNG